MRDLLVDMPHGMRTLGSFFGAGPIPATPGNAPSSAAIRHRIRELVDQEEAASPASDADLAAILSRDGMMLARRTVTKLRGELGIPVQGLRRRKGAP